MEPLDICTQSFSNSMGLPCAHQLHQLHFQGIRSISRASVLKFWFKRHNYYIESQQQIFNVHDPHIICISRSRFFTVLSGFEKVNAANKRAKTCGLCGQEGHNRRCCLKIQNNNREN